MPWSPSLPVLLLLVGCAPNRASQSGAAADSRVVAADSTAPSIACASPPSAPPNAISLESGSSRNVDGRELATCGTSPMTGAYRDGRCTTGPDDAGVHVVCARVTVEFLTFTRERGNDLVTPRSGFPGLRPGDRWCLCGARWAEAEAADVAPPVDLAATEASALRFATRETLARHALH